MLVTTILALLLARSCAAGPAGTCEGDSCNPILASGACAVGGCSRISRDDAAVLFVDHQSGLTTLVQDYAPEVFRNNVLGLAKTAKLFNLPVVLTTSFENGPNGPMWPELKEMFPKAAFIPRPGQINAWDNEDFVKAVKATGRKQLIIAGILTEVCVAFPTLSALKEGFEVFVVADASGTFSQSTRDATLMRMNQAGAIMMTWITVASELQRDWRNNPEALAKLFGEHMPLYGQLITSYKAAQSGAK